MSPTISPAEIDAQAANDKAIEDAFYGEGDPVSGLDEMPPPEGTPAPGADDVLGDLDAIEKDLSGGGTQEAEEAETRERENEPARTPDGGGDEEDGESAEEDDGGGDGEEDEGGDDDDEETVSVNKKALKELYKNYDAALAANKQTPEAAEQERVAQETRAEAAQADIAAATELNAKQYAKALAGQFEPVTLTPEQADQFGITEHEAFNEFFSGVQRSIGAQALASMSGQLPNMIIQQTSQALPFVLAAQQFIDNNPEWENHTAIVEAALLEAKKANPNASPRVWVRDMEKRINIAAKKGAAIAGTRLAKNHDTRTKKGQFKANGRARNSGGKKGNRGRLTTDDAIRSMIEGSPGETDDDLDKF